VFFDPSPPSPLPSEERGGIEAAFRPDEKNFNAMGLGPTATSFHAIRGLIAGHFARGLPSNGGEGLWNPVNVKTWEGEAPAEPPNADPRCERLPAFLRSSRDRCSARGRDAAQQELRPPGTDSNKKVYAPAGRALCHRAHRRTDIAID
jgi:hypothetical protein